MVILSFKAFQKVAFILTSFWVLGDSMEDGYENEISPFPIFPFPFLPGSLL